MSSSKRITIGVFASQVGRAWGAQFLAGVTDAAKELDVNLVHFIGGKLSPTPNGGSKPSFGLYDLATPMQFHGLLLTADVAHGVSAADLETFRASYGDIPMVTQSVPLAGATMFIPDNVQGMSALIRHLIEHHGYKRIAFIRGLAGQIDAEQRFQAYRDELKAHNLRFDERLVVDGDFTPESGREAVRVLLDERGIRFQAVAAANDRMAFGALEALQQRGMRVPDHVAVTGFDDQREAQALGAPLTTVRQSFYTAGKNALQTLVSRIRGNTVQRQVVTPTQLLIRWSCGCLPENVRQAAVPPREVAKTGKLENKREAAMRALLNSAGITEQDPALPQVRQAFGRAWDAFLLALHEKATNDDFLKIINAMIEVLQAQNLPPLIWHNVLSMMRKYALGGITNPMVMLHAENLFQQARLLTSELSQRWQAYQRLALEQQEDLLQNFSFSMAPAMSVDEIGAAISKHFPEMGIERWYVMFYSDVSAPQSITAPAPESYRLLFQYENAKFEVPRQPVALGTGQLVPRGKTPADHRYTAVVMPLTLAKNRFGFMWVEMGPPDWEVYVRIRNLVSSALLRTMLVSQKEQAQKQVEQLLAEARERAQELALAKEFAESIAAENAKLYSSEQARRRAAEALSRASRQLSSLATEAEVPQQIVAQLTQIIPVNRCALFLEDVNGVPRLRGHIGLPQYVPVEDLFYEAGGKNLYYTVARQGEHLLVGDVKTMPDWKQPEWLTLDRSWLGIPLFAKNKVVGLLTMSRSEPDAFNSDEILLADTFAVQASIALDNARLYDNLNRFNQMLERMVEQRVDELNKVISRLEKLDKNKSDFIQVAAHELRTPLTVIKGYMGMLKAAAAIQNDPTLKLAMDGVLQGADRLHQVVNNMLDVARLENQVLTPHFEKVNLGTLLRLIQKDYAQDLQTRQLTLELDPAINALPPLRADSELLLKALDNVVVNAIKFTPDGGSIHISASIVNEERGGMCEIRIRDTGIGINDSDKEMIFEKLYQVGKVELHSSGKTKFKGGGPGLGLAIAAGIVKAHHGKIWVESPGCDEVKLPGSTFFIHIPLAN
ncbi:MAG: substrate-binding domain-containing protein [Chloroflexi bacterium]|nr:substrate-binding domain-containing protein [Chloroflexota bacterium]MBI5704861.1 substrate-binding domain-containing protein [Chloroflexota bacterium]